jgi:hypothetical protein
MKLYNVPYIMLYIKVILVWLSETMEGVAVRFPHSINICVIVYIICLVWCPGQNKRIAPLFPPWMS